MQADLSLKSKQAFWETPRNLVVVIGTLVGIAAALAGFVGFKLGQNAPAPLPPQIIYLQPAPAAPPAPAR